MSGNFLALIFTFERCAQRLSPLVGLKQRLLQELWSVGQLYNYRPYFCSLMLQAWLFLREYNSYERPVCTLVCTGSTDSFWDISDKQLFMIEWHCIQKPVIFGILNSGNLCLINHLLLFWPNIASTAQDVQTCQIFWEKKSLNEHNVKQFSDFFFNVIWDFSNALFVLSFN